MTQLTCAIMGLAPPSLLKDEIWGPSHKLLVAQSVTAAVDELHQDQVMELFRDYCQFLPRTWKDVCDFDALNFMGFPPAKVVSSGSPMDDLRQTVAEMVVATAWAYKARRGQADVFNTSRLILLADKKNMAELMKDLETGPNDRTHHEYRS